MSTRAELSSPTDRQLEVVVWLELTPSLLSPHNANHPVYGILRKGEANFAAAIGPFRGPPRRNVRCYRTGRWDKNYQSNHSLCF